MDDYNKKNKKKKVFYIIIVILILMNLALFFNESFGRINEYFNSIDINEKDYIPTGNIDVFNINLDCPCDSSCRDIKDTIPVFKEEDKNVLDKVFVDDQNGDYIYQNNLRIFTNSAFNHLKSYSEEQSESFDNKIAPGVSNTYYFVAHNNTNKDLKYIIKMYEETSYKINMKYRLKQNGSYVIGDTNTWVYASELETTFKNISKSSSDVYQLDWKWFDDDENDTYAGINMKDQYKLNIRFYFEEA